MNRTCARITQEIKEFAGATRVHLEREIEGGPEAESGA